ncbi:hypothetical protein HMPREF1109_0294 [Streptococcus intermedius SK54 = ATCC 27335]|nr:hypothetical protein HMPREF1109_0294 [Streptococcus intermedius SK54 = ATCC 27335]EKU16852.1 hypothetical protein D593_1197 [Streptococcus intermedius BA1]
MQNQKFSAFYPTLFLFLSNKLIFSQTFYKIVIERMWFCEI